MCLLSDLVTEGVRPSGLQSRLTPVFHVTTPYTVYHPLSAEGLIEGGVHVSARQQRTALEAAGVSYTEDPTTGHDLVHLNFLGPRTLLAIRRARATDTPVVVHAHSLGDNVAGTHRFSRIIAPFLIKYYQWVYQCADSVVAVSEEVRDRLRSRGVGGPIYVVSNGVDASSLSGLNAVEPAGPDGPTVMNLAQVYESKGIGTFVDVARQVPEAEFRWWGHKHSVLAPRSTKRLVHRSPGNVKFPGYIEDKRQAFAGADIFFSPSTIETQGLSVLEAAYCGLPIVVRDIPVFEYLTDEKTALKGSSEAELAGAVRRLLENPSLRKTLGENAQEWARKHTLDNVGAALRTVYEKTLTA